MKENMKRKDNPGAISVAREDNMRGNSIEVGWMKKKMVMGTLTAQETQEKAPEAPLGEGHNHMIVEKLTSAKFQKRSQEKIMRYLELQMIVIAIRKHPLILILAGTFHTRIKTVYPHETFCIGGEPQIVIPLETGPIGS